MFGSFNMFGEPQPLRPFNTQYRCFSVSMFPNSDKQSVENGGKIIMPPSALDVLTRLNIVYPMLFKLSNRKGNRSTHCGVLEFVADEGKLYIPYWMMRNLLLDEGELVQIESVTLPVATFSKFEPQNVEFLDITNPKAVLENALRNFACLTVDDVIAINYNDRIYELRVLEVRPGGAVSIIECDMNVEFAAPVGYQEPEGNRNAPSAMNIDEEEEEEMPEPAGFFAFQGSGNRLDGKKKNLQMTEDELKKKQQRQRGIPDYDYQPCYIRFWRKVPQKAEVTEKEETEDSDPFSGEGMSLRKAKTRK
ncbi:ubiquitin fusion-degradation 1-like [Oratosquilla oratoria]|uniref:ubiquitin fusion-degradation 1-like n=1 Tax=Oratosquilla oratoria TaxID=337810 RepID=UPI003F75B648